MNNTDFASYADDNTFIQEGMILKMLYRDIWLHRKIKTSVAD